MLGRSSASSASVPLANAAAPASLKRIELEVAVAGQRIVRSFAPQSATQTDFSWNGRDVYGRPVLGGQPATFTVKHVYDAVYTEPAAFASSFGATGGAVIVADRNRNEISLEQSSDVALGASLPPSASVGGWSLSAHHVLDRVSRTLWFGDGDRRDAEAAAYDVKPFTTFLPSNGSTLVAVEPDGSAIYNNFNTGLGHLRGTTQSGFAIQGIPPECLFTRSGEAIAIAFGSNEQMSCAQTDVRFGVDGQARRLCIGRARPPGPGQLAQQAENLATIVLPSPQSLGRAHLTVDGSGVIYAASGRYVYRLVPGGVPQLVFTAPTGFTTGLNALAAAGDGTVFMLTGFPYQIYRLTPSGQVTLVSSNTTGSCNSPRVDGPFDPAAGVCPQTLAVQDDGSLVFVDADQLGTNTVRRLSPDGFVTTLARGGSSLTRLAIGPTGEFIASDSNIRRISRDLGGSATSSTQVSSGDGSELFEFATSGRHVQDGRRHHGCHAIHVWLPPRRPADLHHRPRWPRHHDRTHGER